MGIDAVLDWELGLWQLARAAWARLSPAAPEAAPGAVAFRELEARLGAFAGMIAGRAVRLSTSAHAGGVRADGILLPERLTLGGDPEWSTRAWLLRVAVDATTWARGGRTPSEGQEEASAAAAARSVAALSESLPGFAARWAEVVARADDGELPKLLYGRLLVLETGGSAAGGGEQAERARPETERSAPAPEDVRVLSLSEEDVKEMPLHVFEKVETVEAFSGSLRQLDGDDDLDDHLDGLREIDLSHLVRGGPQAHSLLRADVALEADIPDVETVAADEPFVSYPEWDHRQSAYRPEWCRVFPTPIAVAAPAWPAEARTRLARVIGDLDRRMQHLRTSRAPSPRQRDGEALDVDALVEAHGDLRAGRTPDPRFFVARRRRERGVAWTVLLDLSLSADSYVDGRRVLDVARDAVFALGEVLDHHGDELEILGFASMTRSRVRLYQVRAPGEPWAVGASRLGAIRPVGYTRIGPALRHGTARVLARPAERRVLLLVSDGKPTDYDRYEGSYGIADVRRALGEARAKGVHVHALTVDGAARGHVASMLGPGSWDLLPRPEALSDALAPLIARLG